MPTLDWIGKDKVINHHNDVPYKVLERKYSYDEDGEHKDDIHSENMIIHGDNLEALKSLLPQYEGKIKCIYIDPPYNTRKSSEKNKAWIYSDSVDDPKIEKWLGVTVGDEGEDLSRHDKWLCMMYPRLVLLNKLLSDKGIVFISIDDNECSYLKIICDDIFGKKNFVAQLIWRSDGNFDNQAKIKNVHEYILCYIKNADEVGLPQAIDPSASENSKIYNQEVRNTVVKNGPKNPMSTIKLPIGFPCSVSDLIIKSRKDKFPYYGADAIIEGGRLINEVEVESGWSSKNILMKYINNGFNPVKDTKGQDTVFEITKTGNIEMIKKRGDASHVLSLLQNLGSTQNMSTELAKMGVKFDFPKPVDLVIYLISFYCRKDDIILDSFAGSGTTAHAVLNMNKKDGGNRKFILVEMGDYADTITAERVKRVIDGYGEGKNAVDGTDGNFSYYELGSPLFLQDGTINNDIATAEIRKYIWYTETNGLEYAENEQEKYYLGSHNDTAYYFYYEKDKATILDYSFLATVNVKNQSYIIYADSCALSDIDLQKWNITFKKIPRDIEHI